MGKKYEIRVVMENQEQLIECQEQETLMEALLRQGIPYRADCGGRGTCGKCRLKVSAGSQEVTHFDEKVLSAVERQEGYRLACKAVPEEDLTIVLIDNREKNIATVTDNKIEYRGTISSDRLQDGYVIGIDLGTTTLAMRLVQCKDQTVCATYAAVNPQRSYGADVIARMKASMEGKKEQLKTAIVDALAKGMDALMKACEVETGLLKQIVIAGNTTMVHLLLGYSCEGLGSFPYTPVTVDAIHLRYLDLFPGRSEVLAEAPLTIFPGISTFVGGDVVSGLAVCGYHEENKLSLLIDFGTNGELALGNHDHILVTSTAAGPAFEGGNISCGMGSVPGAVSHIRIHHDRVEYETIGNLPPIGICGTGVVELVSELYRTGIIDDTGLLSEEFFDQGYPFYEQGQTTLRITQKDMRELQLAKAAVRAGIEVLLLHYGVTADQVEQVYLAGGFGFSIDKQKAIHIGLLPKQWENKIIVIGNSSLAGAIQYAIDPELARKVEQIRERSEEVSLSNDEAFQDLFIRNLSFE